MLKNYKNNLIKIAESKYNTFWYVIYINNVMQGGQERSIESGIEYAEYLIEDAISILSKIDQDTVIDNVWEDYLMTKDNISILDSLKLLTGYSTYAEILTMYEGFEIGEFLKRFK